MKFSLSFILLCLSLSVERVYGWGMKGHEAVGYFLAPEASSFVETSLSGPQYHSSLGFAAPWADEVRRQKGYAWSAPLHFVDAEDQPPTECSVNQKRDCAGNGCILTAIANYTSRVVDTSLSDSDRQEALKFIDHFIGDIGQPLHVEGIERGGNGIHVQCAGNKNNLHSVHDGIINKLLDDEYDGSVIQWVNSLTERIQQLDCLRAWIKLPFGVRQRADCPRTESNAYDCSFVWTYDSYEDLCSDDNNYYSGAVPIIEMQIAKQGYRLAAWLNVLFDGKTNLP
ncbi:nuclease Le3 [Lentinula edodes]|nr:nuclease Le3 [Lentinula edodes]